MDEIQLLIFRISDQSFTIPISRVARVVDTLQSRSFPLLKEKFEGMFIFENKLIPIIKLADSLGFTGSNIYYTNLDESVVIINYDGYFFGFRVDAIEGIKKVKEEDVKPIEPEIQDLNGLDPAFLNGFTESDGQLVFSVSTEKLLVYALEN
ncbi:MAG: chemotaxis protein CheW [Bacteroidetes bacterium]|nr:chemotaxis protein CheW [Bacteroidota bacterium]